MYLSGLHLHGYKSFLDSGLISLKPGFNILTGQNNAGKTALLEALGLQFSNKPHRSLATSPTPNSPPGHTSRALIQVVITQEELQQLLPKASNQSATILLSKRNFPTATGHEEFWEGIQAQRSINLDIAYNSNNAPHIRLPLAVFSKQLPASSYFALIIQRTTDGRFLTGHTSNPTATINEALGSQLVSRIYSFRAERMKIGTSSFGSNEQLQTDASNLPEVLHVLQSTNPARFKKYNELVKRVFPQIEWVNVRPVENHSVEILVWAVSPETERADLAVPLSESGTGISQVLAMLYVVVTAEFPRTILIDEPNSFLHPGAVRVLVEILRDHPQHQYIITTHSPELISASNPSTVHIIRRENGASQVESLDTHKAHHLRTLLLEVGSRFSDVFGAENVLWVEGPTEQLCFPLIVRQSLKRPLSGISIIGVLHTGDFDAKTDTRSVFRIYERLTQEGSALLPPAIAFIFDRELRPEKDRQDLVRQSKGRVHFLSRRTYENYLLHTEAITAILNANPPFTEQAVTQQQVQDWLNAHKHNPKYYGKSSPPNYPQDTDAPKLLKDLFADLSGNRLDYNKVEHSVALTEWLLEHAPEELKELAELLSKVLPPPK